ncbi:hypothetical protein MKX03_006018 [Papaver bracteatum]|nr:hypothetical protein MKX03_006018 [Papaver bracteatum]
MISSPSQHCNPFPKIIFHSDLIISNRTHSHVISGAWCLCSSLKSFFSDRVQGMLCSSEPNTFKSINSIILRFPKFKEVLKNIKNEDSNGSIDHEELKKCLNKLQLHLTERNRISFPGFYWFIYLPMDSSDNSHAVPTRISNPEIILYFFLGFMTGSPELFLQYFLAKQILSVNSGKVSFNEFLFALTNWVGIDADDEK